MASELYELEKLLWAMRRDPELTQQFQHDPTAVTEHYGVEEEHARMLRDGDYDGLLAAGANPYLLYFFALHIGVDRAAYYANVRGEEVQ